MEPVEGERNNEEAATRRGGRGNLVEKERERERERESVGEELNKAMELG